MLCAVRSSRYGWASWASFSLFLLRWRSNRSDLPLDKGLGNGRSKHQDCDSTHTQGTGCVKEREIREEKETHREREGETGGEGERGREREVVGNSSVHRSYART